MSSHEPKRIDDGLPHASPSHQEHRKTGYRIRRRPLLTKFYHAGSWPGQPRQAIPLRDASSGGDDAAIPTTVADYALRRKQLEGIEASLAFDSVCRTQATPMELRADAVLQRLRAVDQQGVFDAAGPRRGYGQQLHPRFQGDHFLSNEPLIADTQLLRVARRLPKGAHLHIHFNACLNPRVLLELAREQKRMFITSDRPLVFPEDGAADAKRTEESVARQEARNEPLQWEEEAKEGNGNGTGEASEKPRQAPKKSREEDDDPSQRARAATGANTPNLYLSEIQFSILPPEKESLGDLFSATYKARQTMPFQEFLGRFPEARVGMSAMDWLVSKLVFGEEETYDIPQTNRGAWERFNARTRMMKGLFNYVSVYRKYTELFLQDLLDDNIQYAEIRPNFMSTNQLWHDDGLAQVDNRGIVELIIDACESFKAKRHGGRHFDGIKIIYCTPRCFSRALVRDALAECLRFKLLWPDYIAGFDLVGEEAKGQPLQAFVPEFLDFRAQCASAGVDIPFLFHCGETLEVGTAVDGNLVDALLLGAKRIGHGFALPRHPHVLAEMRARGVCVEVCPISNEVLGLTPRIGSHAVYSLLAQNVPCTLNSDNGTLFRSSLSHDFYQVFVGRADFSLFGWRQLAEWSLDHACLSPAARQTAREHWLAAYRDFIVWLLETYDRLDLGTQDELGRILFDKEDAATALA